jgi:hypothetical protein
MKISRRYVPEVLIDEFNTSFLFVIDAEEGCLLV